MGRMIAISSRPIPDIQSQPGLHSKLQANQVNTLRLCLKNNKKKKEMEHILLSSDKKLFPKCCLSNINIQLN